MVKMLRCTFVKKSEITWQYSLKSTLNIACIKFETFFSLLAEDELDDDFDSLVQSIGKTEKV